MTALSDCFRELIGTDVTDRKMPNIINRGKAAAQIVTAMHREQIMESRRQSAQQILEESQVKQVKDLRSLGVGGVKPNNNLKEEHKVE
jgi:hypothetical protein